MVQSVHGNSFGGWKNSFQCDTMNQEVDNRKVVGSVVDTLWHPLNVGSISNSMEMTQMTREFRNKRIKTQFCLLMDNSNERSFSCLEYFCLIILWRVLSFIQIRIQSPILCHCLFFGSLTGLLIWVIEKESGWKYEKHSKISLLSWYLFADKQSQVNEWMTDNNSLLS